MKNKLTFETPFETYQAVRKIGEGGSGRVYEVRNSSDEQYAAKTLSAERVTTEKLKRFKNEIGFCLKNRHENIVEVIDTGVLMDGDVKTPFYIMPFYPETLRSRMNGLNANEVLPVYSKILNGVEAAHLLGVWHRDIKPENILLNNDTLVLADFGIAHFSEEEIVTAVETKVAARMANFMYAAPEQKIRGANVDGRADIYSLGLLLNEMFTSEVPQGAGITPISSVSEQHQYLDELVAEMMQQNPEKRPSNIQRIKETLISRQNEFVALQRLSEAKNEVVELSEPKSFTPIEIVGLDYDGRHLVLKLNSAPPQEWIQEFGSVRGVRHAVTGFEPERFRFQGDSILIPGVRDDQEFIQKIVNHSKDYVSSGNRGYSQYIRSQAEKQDQEKREALRKRVEKEERKSSALNTISNIKL